MLGEKVISKVFLELIAQKCWWIFIVLFYQSIMYNQTRNTVRDGLQVAVVKNLDLKGKWLNFIIDYEQ